MLNTTSTNSLILNTSKYYEEFRHIQNILTRTTFPFILIVACIGLITNTATIILLSRIFLTNNTRHKWTLIALALSDLLHNGALSIRVIHDLNKEKSEYICMIIAFLSQLAELLSACYTVLFTIQRYLAVRYPLRVAIHKQSSPFVILCLIFILNFLFCFALSYASTYIDCHEELSLNWFIADALFSFIIPFSLILIFNIRIVRLIKQHAHSTITKQSIILRPRKQQRNFHRHNGSIIDSQVNSLTLPATVYEIEMENKINPKKINSIEDNQIIDVSIPLTQNDDIKLQTNSSQSSIKSRYYLKNLRQHSTISQSIRVTRMLVLVSTCFLILNAPVHLCVIAAKIYVGTGPPVFNEHIELDRFQQRINLTNHQIKDFVFIHTEYETKLVKTSDDIHPIDDNISIYLFYIAIQITQWISYLSYSINFFLYSFNGIHFRTNLRKFWNNLRQFSSKSI